MICAKCEHRKQIDAVEVMNGAPDWVCTCKHSECEDIVCLLRMIIWQLYNMEEDEI
jgi:hypothetical protein